MTDPAADRPEASASLRSVIFLSTPTSGNGSLFRSITAIARRRYEPTKWVERLMNEGRLQEAAKLAPPTIGAVIKHNAPEHYNPEMRLADYRYIINARDPRDMVCNQFYWQFVHPNAEESDEQTAERRGKVAAAGIDAFALRWDNTRYLRPFLNLVRRLAPADRIFVGYAMYCLHFDDVAARIGAFLGVDVASLPKDQRKELERERVENLPGNRGWIGHRWPGADTAPGRHRTELQPETIRILTDRNRWFLDFLRRIDDPRVAETYD